MLKVYKCMQCHKEVDAYDVNGATAYLVMDIDGKYEATCSKLCATHRKEFLIGVYKRALDRVENAPIEIEKL